MPALLALGATWRACHSVSLRRYSCWAFRILRPGRFLFTPKKCERYSATHEYPAEFRNGRVFRALRFKLQPHRCASYEWQRTGTRNSRSCSEIERLPSSMREVVTQLPLYIPEFNARDRTANDPVRRTVEATASVAHLLPSMRRACRDSRDLVTEFAARNFVDASMHESR